MTGGHRQSGSQNDWNTLDVVYSDLSGPFPVPLYGNSLEYITLIDDATRVAWVRFIKQKSETIKIIKYFVTEMDLQHHKTLKAFPKDNGGEYVTKDLKRFFDSKGIIHDFTPRYSAEPNGVAEHLNQTIGDELRAMLGSAVTNDKKLWAEGVLTSVYIKNHEHHSAIKNLTPYEPFCGSKPLIQHL